MNYIVMSEKVEAYLQDEYRILCFEQEYIDTFIEYVNSLFLYNTEVRIYNRVQGETEYKIIGKGYYIKAGRHHSNENCFYAYAIEKYRENSKYLEMFSQTMALPGEWRLITFDEGANIRYEESASISEFLDRLKGSYREYYEFKHEWERWDVYNSKLNELSEKRERESECMVEKTILEHDVFVIKIMELKSEYREDTMVSVRASSGERYIVLGKILAINQEQKTIAVAALNEEVVESYRNGALGDIRTIRISDHGTKARLRRQKDALKRLFDKETANINLKEILMGNFSYGNLTVREDLNNSVNGMFGTNLRQEYAYRNALSTDDIYMIQGPPGTGKTTVITEIVKKIVGEGKTVLVSSETNIAVDNALEKVEHQDGVIAVRLGKEERIGRRCQQYMPKSIASTIRHDALELLETRKNSQNTFEIYRQEIEEKWKKKILEVEEQIASILAGLPVDVDFNELYREIISYEKNTKILRDLYDEINACKNEYDRYAEAIKEVKDALLQIDAQIKVLKEEDMKSGFSLADDMVKGKEEGLLREKAQLENKYASIAEKQKSISVESKKAVYIRKSRRINDEKKKLLKYINDEIGFVREIFVLKHKIEDMSELIRRKEILESEMESEIKEANISYIRDKELLESSKEIREEWAQILKSPSILDSFENLYLSKTNAVFATCTGIASLDNGIFAQRDYDYVIVDEAAKCNSLDILIPLVMGKKLILVGDHKQLYPMLETEGLSEEISDNDIQELKEHTLFKRLFEERVPENFKIMMNKQYRMPLDISQFASEHFYNGELETEKKDKDELCMFWIDIPESVERQMGNSTSYYNDEEAVAICELLSKLDKSVTQETDVGVICTYKAQANYINNLLAQTEYEKIICECSTVDAFQGKEKSIIIFNTVRSAGCTDFVSDDNRTNVAITRAKELLYVVGNSHILKHRKAGILKELYHYIRKRGAIYNTNYLKN